MKEINILITAGGTTENIDPARTIANNSSGKLGSIIAQTISDRFCWDDANELTKDKSTTLQEKAVIISKPRITIHYVSNRKAYKPELGYANIIFHTTTNTQSVLDTVTDILKNNKIDVVIHSMAISDYTVDWVSLMDGTKLDNSKKISSEHDELLVKLKKTPKVINTIKEVSPDTKLFGFKLLSGVKEEDLVAAAKHQIEAAKSDYVICNDLQNINAEQHKAIIVDKEGNIIEHCETKEDIANKIYELIK